MVFTVDGNMHSEHVALTREKKTDIFWGKKINFVTDGDLRDQISLYTYAPVYE